ncbi:MAG: hypothetical protein AAFR36_24885 [Bacteroidota bacterium]
MKRVLGLLLAVVVLVTPALADQTMLESAVQIEVEGYEGEVLEATNTKMVQWFQGQNDLYFAIEIDVGGANVSGIRKTFGAMKFAMETIEINDEVFVYDGGTFTLLVEKAILVRAYGSAPKTEIAKALGAMDIASLAILARGI